MRNLLFASMVLLAAVTPASALAACSVFNHSGTDTLMVGRNLDWVESSEGRIGFLHPTCDGHGAIYFYMDDHVWPQGGMNDQGLVLGMTAAPYLEITGNPDGATMGWDFWDDLFASCATVDDVLQYLAMFDLGSIEEYFEQGQMMWTDATGRSVIVEGDVVIEKDGDYQVLTNFLQSAPDLGYYPCPRFDLIHEAFETETEPDTEYFTSIIEDAHGTLWGGYTVYSLYYEPTELEVTIYNRGDFDCGVTLDLAEELGNGGYEIWLDELFDGDPCAEGDDDDAADDDDSAGDDDTGEAGDDDTALADDDDTSGGGSGEGSGCSCGHAAAPANDVRILSSPALLSFVALILVRRRG
jgi:hypothetical protein